MAAKPFLFTVDLSPDVSPALLRDLVARICAAAACDPGQAAELTPLVEAALAGCTASGTCELRFEAHDHTLDVAVRAGAEAIWHTSRPLD